MTLHSVYASGMDAIGWDGIYGESDRFLPAADVAAAERESADADTPLLNDSVADLDEARRRRRGPR